MESTLWNKVPDRLQTEVDQMTKGSSQKMFQRLLKEEETMKGRERFELKKERVLRQVKKI